MATRRRTANWLQPPRKEKVLEKGGQRAKEGREGAADISLLLITVKWMGPQRQRCLMDYSLSPVWFELNCSHVFHSTGRDMLTC